MGNKHRLEKLTYNQTVRLTEDLSKKLDFASESLKMAKQDSIRLALEIGLKYLDSINYDLPKVIFDAVEHPQPSRKVK